ncbi:hypothetical protein ElyMa_001742000 [Elysia marginata]|uniref:Uncharacterized protein n=1 Tax=Elysia marginata TaxID=1093978 RepID=A0AAV4JZJ0_9GAST|nr:hypothetical protein ElyMa_001742000 [Elysia marginata]
MPQQTSTFEACSWVPILLVGGLGKVRVNCFPKAIATWHGGESNPRPPDLESDALTTPPRCPWGKERAEKKIWADGQGMRGDREGRKNKEGVQIKIYFVTLLGFRFEVKIFKIGA